LGDAGASGSMRVTGLQLEESSITTCPNKEVMSKKTLMSFLWLFRELSTQAGSPLFGDGRTTVSMRVTGLGLE
jgi:hypothetical protein